MGFPRGFGSWSEAESGLVDFGYGLGPLVHSVEADVYVVGVVGTKPTEPKAGDSVVGVAVAKTDERWKAPVADASPVFPVGKGEVKDVLFVAAPAPVPVDQALECGFLWISSVATGFIARDGFWGRWDAGWHAFLATTRRQKGEHGERHGEQGEQRERRERGERGEQSYASEKASSRSVFRDGYCVDYDPWRHFAGRCCSRRRVLRRALCLILVYEFRKGFRVKVDDSRFQSSRGSHSIESACG